MCAFIALLLTLATGIASRAIYGHLSLQWNRFGYEGFQVSDKTQEYMCGRPKKCCLNDLNTVLCLFSPFVEDTLVAK